MPEMITDSNRELLERLDRIEAHLLALLAVWREYEPVVGAFRRGGMLAARTAARRGSNGKP